MTSREPPGPRPHRTVTRTGVTPAQRARGPGSQRSVCGPVRGDALRPVGPCSCTGTARTPPGSSASQRGGLGMLRPPPQRGQTRDAWHEAPTTVRVSAWLLWAVPVPAHGGANTGRCRAKRRRPCAPPDTPQVTSAHPRAVPTVTARLAQRLCSHPTRVGPAPGSDPPPGGPDAGRVYVQRPSQGHVRVLF